jgi:23S rRNA pseudouridine1911/1915/1917 synthase
MKKPIRKTKPDIRFTAKSDSGLLDCVKSELTGFPSGKIKSFLKHRQISVDGVSTTKFDYPVKKGQLISIRQAPVPESPGPAPDIIYEDDWLIAINKPAGLLTVATDREKEKTAYRMLKDGGREGHIFVVHRLDRDTSGVLLFAKSREIRDVLQSSWEDAVKREYLAICEGVFEQKSGRCDTMLRETSTHLVYSSPYGGKRAITNYEVIRDNGLYSLVRVWIETGRKNQIRVHLSELGHPVVGDKKYGAKSNPLGRLGLHAGLLRIMHPVTNTPLILEAKPGRKFKLPARANSQK